MSEATVRVRLKELIPTAKFANIELDLEIEAEYTAFLDPEQSANITEALETAYDNADAILQKKRDPIIEELEKGQKGK